MHSNCLELTVLTSNKCYIINIFILLLFRSILQLMITLELTLENIVSYTNFKPNIYCNSCHKKYKYCIMFWLSAHKLRNNASHVRFVLNFKISKMREN